VIMSSPLFAPSRRALMLGSGALFAWTYAPKLARAEGRDPRLLVIVLRGALDGLALAAPVGDPDWVRLRGDRALVLNGTTPALPLDSMFALNPAMPNLYRLYQAGEAIIVHAAATPYRERSHFDGQDVLESGYEKPGRSDSGWLNRALSLLAPDERVNPQGGKTFAVGPVTPLVVRGSAPVMSWVPQYILPASDDTQARLLDLYRHTDAKLANALAGRKDLLTVARSGGLDTMQPREQLPTAIGMARVREYFADVASAAAKYLARPDGPRVGALSLSGWDTHVNEGAAAGQLAQYLGALDGAVGAIERSMVSSWRETVVALITEFGRTARINGTDGTDHGTGTTAMLVGGALRGGRVIADWPGLKPANLFEDRDLAPTTDLRAVMKGVLKDHLRLDDAALAASVFPGSRDVKPLAGLLAQG